MNRLRVVDAITNLIFLKESLQVSPIFCLNDEKMPDVFGVFSLFWELERQILQSLMVTLGNLSATLVIRFKKG